MKRKIVNFTWDNEDAQEAFAEWCPFPDTRATADQVDRIEKLARIKPPLRVLDVGCGNGRHSIELARRGYKVVGIDVAKRFLTEAKENLSASGQNVEFRFQRASELTESQEYDFALAYWHTLGFMTDDEIKRHFNAVFTALKNGASFLYVFQGPRLFDGQESKTTRNWQEQNGRFIMSEKSVQQGFRMENCIVIDTNTGKVTEYREKQRAIRFEEVMQYLKGAGFNRVNAYNDFDETPATPDDFSIFLCVKQ